MAEEKYDIKYEKKYEEKYKEKYKDKYDDKFLTNVSNEPEDLVLAEERTTEADRELIMDGEPI